MIRRRRLVRLHLAGDHPSLEGILLGTSAGHYRLANARHIVDEDNSFNLDGEAWVPRERVLYLQVIG